ncbi:MAG: hypothetical protein WHT07_08200 [Desulfobaccales bacterium]
MTTSWWHLLLKLAAAFLEFWRFRRQEEARERCRRRVEQLDRERRIEEEVAHVRTQVEDELVAKGGGADAYRDAFRRVRELQRS